MNLCVIPARGGSKRIPRKNIRMFCGKPMIAWSIEAAQQSCCFDQVLVSSDDLEICELAQSLGAIVPFIRPSELADDFTGTLPVLAHAVQWCMREKVSLEAVCCLYATAPFVRSDDLNNGLDLLQQTPLDRFVFTATTYEAPIQRALKINPYTGNACMYEPQNFNKRSQDLENCYHDAGQFYWGRSNAWLSSQNLLDGSKMLLLPRWRVQDIDTEQDWHYAELMKKILDRQ